MKIKVLKITNKICDTDFDLLNNLNFDDLEVLFIYDLVISNISLLQNMNLPITLKKLFIHFDLYNFPINVSIDNNIYIEKVEEIKNIKLPFGCEIFYTYFLSNPINDNKMDYFFCKNFNILTFSSDIYICNKEYNNKYITQQISMNNYYKKIKKEYEKDNIFRIEKRFLKKLIKINELL